MKKLLFLVCLSVTWLHADKNYELFLQAHQKYNEGHYKQALKLYNEIDCSTAALSYNKAVVLHTLGDPILAFAHSVASEQKAQGDLLKKVYALQDQLRAELGLPEKSVWQKIVYLMQNDIWLGLVQIVFLLLLFSLLFNFFTKKLKVKILIVRIALICFLGLRISAYYYVHSPQAVVIKKEASLYLGPDKNLAVMSTISGGLQGRLIDENENWCKMQFHKSRGWIPKEDVLIIKDLK